MLTSTHNPKIQRVRALMARPKDRREEKAFVVEGVRLLEEAASAEWPFQFVLFTDDLSQRGKSLLGLLEARHISCELVDTGLFASLSDTQTSQGILAVVDLSPLPVPEKLSFALILDSVRDPGNLGTLLRTAAAAGVEATFLPPETTDAFAPKVVRAGMGAHFHLPIQELSWEAIRERMKGLTIYLAEMEGSLSCWEADLRAPLALIIGGEAEGASASARQLAQKLITIPMPGRAESLNAAVAGGILMFEVVQQRNK